MKKSKDIRTLCYKCKSNYQAAGYQLISIGSKHKHHCEICNNFNAFDYLIQDKK